MSRRRDLRRFPPGESCEQCGSTWYYFDSGFAFCQDGHLQEHLRQFAADDDDDFARGGRVSRKEKEVKKSEARHLTGGPARELYLECLQLLLRKQVFRLVQERGLPAQLETVVRDLWELRTRGFANLFVESEGNDSDPKAAQDDVARGQQSDLELFVSENEEADKSDSATQKRTTSTSKLQDWSSDRLEHWRMPTPIDTLVLCYLGCVLLRLPVRIGDMVRWAKTGQLPFLRALDEMTSHMIDRLPGRYQFVLLTRSSQLTAGGGLHEVVSNMVASYYFNCGLSLPAINRPLITLQYLRDLALPPEVYVYVGHILGVLDANLTFPEKRESRAFGNPDTLLTACIAVGVKILYPFDGIQRRPMDFDDLAVFQMDWAAWESLVPQSGQEHSSQADTEELRSPEVWNMSEAQIDNYMDSYESFQVKGRDAGNPLKQLFPLDDRHKPSVSQPKEPSGAEVDQVIAAVISHMKPIEPVPESEDSHDSAGPKILRPGSQYRQYGRLEDLEGPAKTFHEKLAYLAGLPLAELIRAVYLVERRLLHRTRARSKGKEVERASSEA